MEEDAHKVDYYRYQFEAYQEERKHAAKAAPKRSATERELEWMFSPPAPEPPKQPMRRLVVTDATTAALATILVDNPAGLLAVFDELAQRWMLFRGAGWRVLGGAIAHTVFARQTARRIGWEANGFQS